MNLLTGPSLQSDDTGVDRHRPEYLEKIVRFLKLVLEPGTAVELRAIKVDGNGTFTRLYSTDDLNDLARDALDLSGRCKGVYFTLNPLAPAVLSEGRSARTSDVIRRRWLLIDADVATKGNQSATNREKAQAGIKIREVREDLQGRGWPDPIVCDSGNGYHLLYRIDLPTEDGALIRQVLHALAESHDWPDVKIDRKVFDPPRICKLPYTWACTGENTPKRPHRLACVVKMPEEVQVVSQAQLESLAGPVGIPSQTSDGCPGGLPVVPPEHLSQVTKWASNYVKWMKPAIEGKGGDAQTFRVICTLANDFALPFEEAWPILLRWNARCEPPWEEDELVRKWEYAETTSKGPRGAKIPSRRIRRSLRPP